MYIDDLYSAKKVESRYEGVQVSKLIELENYYGEKIKMRVEQTTFKVIGTLGYTYTTNVLVMEDGYNFEHFEQVIAEKVCSMLKELNLMDLSFKKARKEEDKEAVAELSIRLQEFVFSTFEPSNTSNHKVDYTFNDFFERLFDICILSANAILQAESEEEDVWFDYYTNEEIQRRFELLTNKSQSWGDLICDTGKKVNICVKPHKLLHSKFQVNTYKKMRNVLQKVTNVFAASIK